MAGKVGSAIYKRSERTRRANKNAEQRSHEKAGESGFQPAGVRAVFDTNVLLSALIQPLGPSGCALARLLSEDADPPPFDLLISSAIIDEARETIATKKRLRKIIVLDDQAIADWFDDLALIAEIVEPGESYPSICRDPDDDVVLATARAGMASHLVTGDKDLLVLAGYQGTAIVTPREFLLVVGEAR